MRNVQKFYFFRCYHCGEWYYSNKIIKTKKCWKCNRSFQFKNSFKIVRTVTLNDAIKIIKKIKMKGEKETLFKFLDYEKSLN
ncbi:MAG: DUF1922 domain-containing protein [Candidatus Lokiarchaeota archaeon]|nr:DUF1922 domain-containing protein [Candidatus Lokiarchaeota archaeon]